MRSTHFSKSRMTICAPEGRSTRKKNYKFSCHAQSQWRKPKYPPPPPPPPVLGDPYSGLTTPPPPLGDGDPYSGLILIPGCTLPLGYARFRLHHESRHASRQSKQTPQTLTHQRQRETQACIMKHSNSCVCVPVFESMAFCVFLLAEKIPLLSFFTLTHFPCAPPPPQIPPPPPPLSLSLSLHLHHCTCFLRSSSASLFFFPGTGRAGPCSGPISVC